MRPSAAWLSPEQLSAGKLSPPPASRWGRSDRPRRGSPPRSRPRLEDRRLARPRRPGGRRRSCCARETPHTHHFGRTPQTAAGLRLACETYRQPNAAMPHPYPGGAFHLPPVTLAIQAPATAARSRIPRPAAIVSMSASSPTGSKSIPGQTGGILTAVAAGGVCAGLPWRRSLACHTSDGARGATDSQSRRTRSLSLSQGAAQRSSSVQFRTTWTSSAAALSAWVARNRPSGVVS